MDNFYQAYKGEDDFWELEDFISMVGNTVASMYLSAYQQAYQMLRQDKKQEVITFDAGWLLSQIIDVETVKGKSSAILSKPVMTFPYDNNSIGIQDVFIIEPNCDEPLERTSLGQLWQLKYIDEDCNVKFFYADVPDYDCKIVSKIGFKNAGNVKKVKVYYVPSMNDGDALVCDGMISDAITKTILSMKQIATGTVVDETPNSNSNKILQTELDKSTLSR